MADETTWRISQLTDWINAVVATSLGGEIWVEGEVSNLQRSSAGHVYFTLVERDEGSDGRRNAASTLAVTLFDWHRTNVNRHLKRSGGAVRMGDGVRVRIRGSVEVYAARSQLQLKMTGIDPVFTLGSLAADRARLLEQLRADGLLDANRSLPTPVMPLRLAVVTSVGSAAHADALDELTAAGIGFDITVIHSLVQGVDAPQRLVEAIGAAELVEPDLILVVRGGGARTDLIAFDDESVARAIASCPIPVWVGLGHETDRTVADEVAHRSWKTPTAVAGGVLAAVDAAATDLETIWESILDRVESTVVRASTSITALGTRIAAATAHDLRQADRSVIVASTRLDRLADARLHSAEQQLRTTERAVARAARVSLADAELRLGTAAAVVRANDPATTLARGWSITRTSTGARATAASVSAGDTLITTFADGVVQSTVTDQGPTA